MIHCGKGPACRVAIIGIEVGLAQDLKAASKIKLGIGPNLSGRAYCSHHLKAEFCTFSGFPKFV